MKSKIFFISITLSLATALPALATTVELASPLVLSAAIVDRIPVNDPLGLPIRGYFVDENHNLVPADTKGMKFDRPSCRIDVDVVELAEAVRKQKNHSNEYKISGSLLQLASTSTPLPASEFFDFPKSMLDTGDDFGDSSKAGKFKVPSGQAVSFSTYSGTEGYIRQIVCFKPSKKAFTSKDLAAAFANIGKFVAEAQSSHSPGSCTQQAQRNTAAEGIKTSLGADPEQLRKACR